MEKQSSRESSRRAQDHVSHGEKRLESLSAMPDTYEGLPITTGPRTLGSGDGYTSNERTRDPQVEIAQAFDRWLRAPAVDRA
jgi:hypothetical protein